MQKKMTMKGNRTIVRVASGKTFYVDMPTKQDISLYDIAHHLSQCNRYNGACAWPYSVARHCLHVASILPRNYKLAGLMHDAPDAFLGDIVRPLKVLMDEYKDIEKQYQLIVEEAFNLPENILSCKKVAEADCQVMSSEMDSKLLGWHDIHEFPLADIVIKETSWLEDRFQFAATAGILLMPVDKQNNFMRENKYLINVPKGFVDSFYDFTPDNVEEFVENAKKGTTESINLTELDNDAATIMMDINESILRNSLQNKTTQQFCPQ